MKKTAFRVTASAAIKREYYRSLLKLIEEMNNSVNWWLGAVYNRNEDRIVASDSASKDVEIELKKLMKRWQKRFDESANTIALRFVKDSANHSNNNFKSLLNEMGWTVKLKLSRNQKDKMQAVLIENINLIKSIPQKYFTELTTVTMESITRGRDLVYMRDEIAKRFGVCKRRAATIAREQNNKATSHINSRKIWDINKSSKIPVMVIPTFPSILPIDFNFLIIHCLVFVFLLIDSSLLLSMITFPIKEE